MNFLLKVKRAKFVLDKARKWMWKVPLDNSSLEDIHFKTNSVNNVDLIC